MSAEQGKVIHAWSGPRSLSTAMMYSFAQRGDCQKVFDEPLYAQHLHAFPEIFRPYRAELCDKNTETCNEVLERLNSEAQQQHSVVYAKHMIKHLLSKYRSSKQYILHQLSFSDKNSLSPFPVFQVTWTKVSFILLCRNIFS